MWVSRVSRCQQPKPKPKRADVDADADVDAEREKPSRHRRKSGCGPRGGAQRSERNHSRTWQGAQRPVPGGSDGPHHDEPEPKGTLALSDFTVTTG